MNRDTTDQRIYVSSEEAEKRRPEELVYACFAHAQPKGCLRPECPFMHYGKAGSVIAHAAALQSRSANLEFKAAKGARRSRVLSTANNRSAQSRSLSQQAVVRRARSGVAVVLRSTSASASQRTKPMQRAAAPAPAPPAAPPPSMPSTPALVRAVVPPPIDAPPSRPALPSLKFPSILTPGPSGQWSTDCAAELEFALLRAAALYVASCSTEYENFLKVKKANATAFLERVALIPADTRDPVKADGQDEAANQGEGHNNGVRPYESKLCPHPTCWRSFATWNALREHTHSAHGEFLVGGAATEGQCHATPNVTSQMGALVACVEMLRCMDAQPVANKDGTMDELSRLLRMTTAGRAWWLGRLLEMSSSNLPNDSPLRGWTMTKPQSFRMTMTLLMKTCPAVFQPLGCQACVSCKTCDNGGWSRAPYMVVDGKFQLEAIRNLPFEDEAPATCRSCGGTASVCVLHRVDPGATKGEFVWRSLLESSGFAVLCREGFSTVPRPGAVPVGARGNVLHVRAIVVRSALRVQVVRAVGSPTTAPFFASLDGGDRPKVWPGLAQDEKVIALVLALQPPSMIDMETEVHSKACPASLPPPVFSTFLDPFDFSTDGD